MSVPRGDASTSALTLVVSASQTTAALAVLSPFLIHERPWGAVETVGEDQRRITLHPRVREVGTLPASTLAACAALDGRWSARELGPLTPAERVRLFTVVFFSQSKPGPALAPDLPAHWRQVLSNFHAEPVTIDDKRYASVEHYFQAAKALASTRPEMASWYEQDSAAPEAVGPHPGDAKRAGARASYARAGARLNEDDWVAQRLPAMTKALRARWEQQPLFRAVLRSTQGMDLLHFERAGAAAFWGGSISRSSGLVQGENQLGRLLMTLRDGSTAGPPAAK